MKTWHELPYLATDNVIFVVLELWPSEWCTPTNSVVEAEKVCYIIEKGQSKTMDGVVGRKTQEQSNSS